jgi:hypothetical protein
MRAWLGIGRETSCKKAANLKIVFRINKTCYPKENMLAGLAMKVVMVDGQ